MKRIYIAGPYSADNVLGVLRNMRRGINIATQVFKGGYAPFCPHLDYQFTLMADEYNDFEVNDYYAYSMAWLEVSDAVLVLPNSELSKGVQAEIERAKELNIPVFEMKDISEDPIYVLAGRPYWT